MPLQSTSGAATYDAFGVSAVSAVTQAEAIDFDGTNDYLSTAGPLTGSVNGKTFTLSAWIWVPQNLPSGGSFVYFGNSAVEINVTANNSIRISCLNTSFVPIVDAETAANSVVFGTFLNILVSIDTSSTARRFVYINDVAQTVTWSTYTNAAIWFASNGANYVGTGSNQFRGRLSNEFFDFTYRDLSITANRRLFVTADLKPAAGQAALTPLMYLTMADPTQAGANLGTGGNFTTNGVVARSGRGPNQYNAPYSDLDGAADYLSRTTAPTGIADGKQFTLHCAFSCDTPNVAQRIINFSTNTAYRFAVFVFTSGDIQIFGVNPSGITVLDGVTAAGVVVANRNYTVDISIDLTSTANRFLYVNGQSVSVTWNTYTDDNIDFAIATTPRYHIGASPTPSQYFNGRLGAVWFNTSYIDLSVPANLAKFVTGTGINAKPVDLGATGELPTGSSPFIYLPMYGNDAGRNYGTGGNFTVNSGPYTGARGPNEFWGNLADFTANPYLSRTTALTGITNTKQITLSFWATFDNWGQVILSLADSAGNFNVYVDNASNRIRVFACNAAGAIILQAETPATLVTGTRYYIQMCADMTSTTLRAFYINGVSVAATWSYTNDTIAYQQASLPTIGAYWNGSQYTAASRLDGRISELYLSNGFVDFRFEANRLKFIDAFGNPVDLTAQIAAASIPTPAIYMRFPPTAFGTNSGTGGNFTVNGTITDGGQL